MSKAEFHRPELVIGLVGPIGCDIQAVEKALVKALKQVDYTCRFITVSESIKELLNSKENNKTTLVSLKDKINAGNKVRKIFENNGILAAHSIIQIRKERANVNQERVVEKNDDTSYEEIRANDTAYIVRQLKRLEEVELLERVYGKQFIQVSVTQDTLGRLSNLKRRLGREQPVLSYPEREKKAKELVEIDEIEEDEIYGQRVSEVFHRGDVFINSKDEVTTNQMTQRFINALFGRTNIAPTRDEMGSYFAEAASLRSVDLSRQVGAAVFSKSGDILAVGCNEVPKPGGGNYWDEDKEKSRDIDRGGEANKEETERIIFDFLRVLSEYKLFKDDREPSEILKNAELKTAISDSLIGDITEYGRMVHAEMNAICDATRCGRSLKDSSLYVTTFPCHNCAKHIIAVGIARVVYIEPYPKSRTDLLYGDAITNDKPDNAKVIFAHFEGISPRRFRDIFEKGKRRNKDGVIQEWYKDTCSPRIGNQESDYVTNESHAINDNFSTGQNTQTPE